MMLRSRSDMRCADNAHANPLVWRLTGQSRIAKCPLLTQSVNAKEGLDPVPLLRIHFDANLDFFSGAGEPAASSGTTVPGISDEKTQSASPSDAERRSLPMFRFARSVAIATFATFAGLAGPAAAQPVNPSELIVLTTTTTQDSGILRVLT